MSKKFQKTKEDFVCENCHTEVKGSGFTNHCPKCLFSKHVDINPGDREESCGGLMKPIGALKKGDVYSIVHQCQKCGEERKCKMAKEDNFDHLTKIVKQNSSL